MLDTYFFAHGWSSYDAVMPFISIFVAFNISSISPQCIMSIIHDEQSQRTLLLDDDQVHVYKKTPQGWKNLSSLFRTLPTASMEHFSKTVKGSKPLPIFENSEKFETITYF